MNNQVQQFYNQSSSLWLETWGEQMHHGYYPIPLQASRLTKKDHRLAQIEMIEMLLNWSEINSAKHILDLGCGVGGTARYVARKFDARAVGYTISDVQAKFGQNITLEKKLNHQVKIFHGDVMIKKFDANYYDLIFAIESAEHMDPKQELFNKIANALTTDGTFIMAAWTLSKPFDEIEKNQQKSIRNICKYLHIEQMLSRTQFISHMHDAGLSLIESQDITEHVIPFWKGVLVSAFSRAGIKGLFTSGLSTIRGAWGIGQMQKAYRNRSLRYVIYQARKTAKND